MAEGGGLLNRYTVKSRIGGSNPPLSAIFYKGNLGLTHDQAHATKARAAVNWPGCLGLSDTLRTVEGGNSRHHQFFGGRVMSVSPSGEREKWQQPTPAIAHRCFAINYPLSTTRLTPQLHYAGGRKTPRRKPRAALRSHRSVITRAEVGGIGVDILRAAAKVIEPYQCRPV